eukprot:13904733-Alexandrium_andersonii.AAC.1
MVRDTHQQTQSAEPALNCKTERGERLRETNITLVNLLSGCVHVHARTLLHGVLERHLETGAS